MGHTSFSIPLLHYFPGYSVEKGFSKICILVGLVLGQPLKQKFTYGATAT